MLAQLPLDISTFSELKKSQYVYVDKTQYAYDLITGGRRYFLSRPRRFGKSLFVSTLEEILHGNKKLFQNLWIHRSDYPWHKYGVIKLDFSATKASTSHELDSGICHQLHDCAQDYNLDINVDMTRPDIALRAIVRSLYTKFGRVAILIDEYDHPILKNLNTTHINDIRHAIQNFFTVIKSLDQYVQFVFITGVSSFTKAGLFSGMNNLRIIGLQKQYAGICGYTQEEVDYYFGDYINTWATNKQISFEELQKKLKEWYNGYYFGINVSPVYNPYSFMYALSEQTFKNYWFQSGTPTFLVEELAKEYRKREYNLFDIGHFEVFEDVLGSFDIGALSVATLMFQTGYLTITGYDPLTERYTLSYPNQEVKKSLQQYLLSVFVQLDVQAVKQLSSDLLKALYVQNITAMVAILKQLLAQVPYQLHIPEEKFYHALLQALFSAIGLKAHSEHSISHGRLDMVIELPNLLYIIEFKINASAHVALAQIEERKYYEPFLHYQKPIVLLGMNFKRTPKKFDITTASRIIEPERNYYYA
ncbi:MAG TPA: AAA family ATPase [Candidatus Babeliales bacterium]|jgi:hypothetical protein|nr:AAA family ATPase [Candidatus Babeliales bacterium]